MLKRYTLVARAAADKSKKHGKSICSAGITPEDGLIRVFPLLTETRMKAWNTYEVNVDRCRTDTREETWQADVSYAPTEIGKEDRYKCLGLLAENNLANSIRQLNADRKSLAVIIPDQINDMWFDTRDRTGADWGKEAVWQRPRVAFKLAGKTHQLQIIEMGCYEWLRNGRNKPEQLWDNLRFTDREYRHMFLIGNMARFRNSWMIIAVMQIKLSLWKHESVLSVGRLEKQTGVNTCSRWEQMRV